MVSREAKALHRKKKVIPNSRNPTLDTYYVSDFIDQASNNLPRQRLTDVYIYKISKHGSALIYRFWFTMAAHFNEFGFWSE